MPVIDLNSSVIRWIRLPLPDDAKLILAGFAFAYAISSATDFTGTLGLTTITYGWVVTCTIGEKSRTDIVLRFVHQRVDQPVALIMSSV